MSQVKATILLPSLDNVGYCLEDEKDSILSEASATFGGYTYDYVQGTYTMDDGSVAHDDSIRLVIIIDKLRVPELRAMVASWGKALRQETMYLDIEPSNVEFVPSAE